AVRVAASKQATARRLAAQGMPVVPTLALAEIAHWPDGPLVIKPDDGAGCEGAAIIRDPAQRPDASAHAKLVMQPLLTGEALSLSAIFAQGQARLLCVNRQMIEQTATGFRLQGCQVNAYADPGRHWQTLAEGVARALPDLWGYAGIDLILTSDGPVILEINPRLTTSYAAIHAATGENPAAAVLELLRTGQLPNPRPHLGQPVDIRLGQSHGG
ncbi:MAG: ATP-grasp domain-containing protein, partial [Candidatus Methylumidiphilus sp.]